MAKKEIRRAARQAGLQPKKPVDPRMRRLRRALVQGVLLAGVYLLLVRLVLRSQGRSLWQDVFWTLIFFFFYTAFIYFWEQFLERRRAKKQQGGAKR
ncbi:MAG: hypothetical protein GX536_05215 [Actinobacteria bacterium]|nr:hypothetical protein [Actinomycetota bacterium]OPZ79448.1 MAG: hypothetical protein BWY79_00451 [Actinobacteria bacterium ADurb.Bin444]